MHQFRCRRRIYARHGERAAADPLRRAVHRQGVHRPVAWLRRPPVRLCSIASSRATGRRVRGDRRSRGEPAHRPEPAPRQALRATGRGGVARDGEVERIEAGGGERRLAHLASLRRRCAAPRPGSALLPALPRQPGPDRRRDHPVRRHAGSKQHGSGDLLPRHGDRFQGPGGQGNHRERLRIPARGLRGSHPPPAEQDRRLHRPDQRPAGGRPRSWANCWSPAACSPGASSRRGCVDSSSSTRRPAPRRRRMPQSLAKSWSAREWCKTNWSMPRSTSRILPRRAKPPRTASSASRRQARRVDQSGGRAGHRQRQRRRHRAAGCRQRHDRSCLDALPVGRGSARRRAEPAHGADRRHLRAASIAWCTTWDANSARKSSSS